MQQSKLVKCLVEVCVEATNFLNTNQLLISSSCGFSSQIRISLQIIYLLEISIETIMDDGLFIMKRYEGEEDDDEDIAKQENNNHFKFTNHTNSKRNHQNFDSNETESNIKEYHIDTCDIEQSTQVIKQKIKKRQRDEAENCNSVHENESELINSTENEFKRKAKKFKSNVEIQQSDEKNELNLSNLAQNDQDLSSNTVDTKHRRRKSKKNINNTSTIDNSMSNGKNHVKTAERAFPMIGKIRHKIENVKPTPPKWLSHPSKLSVDLHSQKTPIADLPYLDRDSIKNLETAGIQYLFPVQTAVIPWFMQKNQLHLLERPSDLCVSAQTGSGKTLAFVLPIVQSLKGRVVCAIRALVVLPGAELAIQVHKVFQSFVKGTDLKTVLLVPQQSFNAEQKALVKRTSSQTLCSADIVVTTPGRIFDHIRKTEGFNLIHLRYLVIDEADRMMEEIQKGWLTKIEDIIFKNTTTSTSCQCFSNHYTRIKNFPTSACQKGHINLPLQKLLFSATLTYDPEKLHSLALYKPKLFAAQRESDDLNPNVTIPEDLVIKSIVCKQDIKPLVLCHFIKQGGFKKVLCFTDTIKRSERLNAILSEMQLLQVRELSSNRTPVQVKITLHDFKTGKVNLLICSDMVSRGIDLEDVDCVISYDMPPYLKTYVHRIGRTARAGKKGVALMLLNEDENNRMRKMFRKVSMPMPTIVEYENAELEQYVEVFKSALASANTNLRLGKKGFKNSKVFSEKQKVSESVE